MIALATCWGCNRTGHAGSMPYYCRRCKPPVGVYLIEYVIDNPLWDLAGRMWMGFWSFVTRRAHG